MKKLQMRQITIISRPTLRLIRDKNPHCLSGGNKLNTNKPAYFPPETACGSTTKGSQFGSFVKRNLDFLANRRRSFADSIKNINKDEAKRSSLDFFDYFLCQDNPPKADRWFHWKKHKKMKQKVSITLYAWYFFCVKTIRQRGSRIPRKDIKNEAKIKLILTPQLQQPPAETLRPK